MRKHCLVWGTVRGSKGSSTAESPGSTARARLQDVDNIAKNIHDALKGVLFADDVQIVQCLTRKIDATREFLIVEETVPDEVL